GNHPRQEVAQEGALDLAGHDDTVLLEIARQIGLDAGGDEHRPAVHRFGEATLDEAVGDGNVGDATLRKIGLELAVGDLRDLRRRREEVLKDHQAEKRRDPVPDIELRLLVHLHYAPYLTTRNRPLPSAHAPV